MIVIRVMMMAINMVCPVYRNRRPRAGSNEEAPARWSQASVLGSDLSWHACASHTMPPRYTSSQVAGWRQMTPSSV